MKVLVVEDEKSAAKRLVTLLNEIDPSIQVLQVIDTVKKTVHWIRNHDIPDLMFLDIQLADGLSFEIFDQISIACPVIFTTAYDQYALKAFEVYSIDYLLKPVESGKLARSLGKYKKMAGPAEQVMDSLTLKEALEMLHGKSFKERFIVKYGGHIRSIPTGQICGFYSEEKVTFLKTYEGRKYVVDYTLEQIGDMVDPGTFFRINRKYIIHLGAIEDVAVYSNSRLKLATRHFQDADLIVAREKTQDFKSWLDK